MADTTYIVLHMKEEMGEQWSLLDPGDAAVEAPNANAAIRKVLSNRPAYSGTYVAVPARSWKPVTVTAETQTVLKIAAS